MQFKSAPLDLVYKFNELVKFEDSVSELLGQPDSLVISMGDGTFSISGTAENNPLDNCTDFSLAMIFEVFKHIKSKNDGSVYAFLFDSKFMGKAVVLFDSHNILDRFESIKKEIALAGMNELLKSKTNQLDSEIVISRVAE